MRLVYRALVVILLLGASVSVQAAPAPTLFAYNNSSKECGTFRDGDERVAYDLPKSWQTYDYSKSIIKTTQAYCDELGYKNIGEVVDYLNLQPKTIRTDLSIIQTKVNINYDALIFVSIVMLLAILAAVAMANRQKNKSL